MHEETNEGTSEVVNEETEEVMNEETNKMDGETDKHARPYDEATADGLARSKSSRARVDRRPWSVAVKLSICAAATLTMLGGMLGPPMQQSDLGLPGDGLGGFVAAAAQRPAPSKQAPARDAGKIDRPTSEPYKGSLSIFEDPRRDEKLQVERVMDVLKIAEGAGVADIGAGSGWFTVRAARRVGARGAVYAVEINPQFVAHIEGRAKAENLPQVRTVLGKEDDPLLPAASIDAALLLKTYHEIAEPVRLMRNLRKSLRAGALVGIIDRKGRGDDHGLDAERVVSEVERAGYALVEQHDFVKPDGMDYFLVFRARD